MDKGIHTFKDVPEDQVKILKTQYENDGCTVEVKKQNNGFFTVIATPRKKKK